MSKRFAQAVLSAVTFAALLSTVSPAKAQTAYLWSGLAGGGNTNWSTTANWFLEPAPPPSNVNDTILGFVDLGLGGSTLSTMDSDFGVRGMEFSLGAAVTNFTIANGGAFTLTLGVDGILNTSGSHAIGVNIALATPQSWINNSTGLSITGTVALGSNLLTVGGTGNTSISGVISGAGGLTKTGSGLLTLSAANTFTGVVSILEGTLSISNKNNVNFDNQTAALIVDGGTLRMTMAGTTTFTAPRPITIGVNDGTIEVTNATARIVYAFPILKTGVGEATFIKSGPGQFALSSLAVTPTAADKLLVTGGYYEAGSENRFSAGVGADAITLNGGGINAAGQLNILNRSITLGNAGGRIGNRYVGASETAAIFQIGSSTSTGGLISGTGDLTIENFNTTASDAWFRFGRVNNYTGNTILTNSAPTAGSLLAVEFTSSGSLNQTGNVTFATDRTILYLGIGNTVSGVAGVSQTVNALISTGGFGTITAPAGTPTLTIGNGGGSGSYSGLITGPATVTKIGAGTQVLTGANTYTGATNINGGTLLINGSHTGTPGPTTVGASGTLGGSGSTNSQVTVNGTIAPGNSVGALTVNNSVTFNSGSNYVVELAATGVVGSGNSDVIFHQGMTINGGNVSFTLLSGTPAHTDVFTIAFANDNQPVTGNFTGLPNGSVVGTYNSEPMYIYYNQTVTDAVLGTFAAKLGNVILTPVPEPTTILAVGALAFGAAGGIRRLRRRERVSPSLAA